MLIEGVVAPLLHKKDIGPELVVSVKEVLAHKLGELGTMTTIGLRLQVVLKHLNAASASALPAPNPTFGFPGCIGPYMSELAVLIKQS